MCRVLVSLKDNTIIHTIEDGEEFGRLEVTPVFGIMELPGVAKSEFLSSLVNGEEAIRQSKEQEFLDKASIRAYDELQGAKDQKEAELILKKYLAKEREELHFKYKLNKLNRKQQEELVNGKVTVNNLSSVAQLTSREVETFKLRG